MRWTDIQSGTWQFDSGYSWHERLSWGNKEHAQVIAMNGDQVTPIARCQSNAKAVDNIANAHLIAAAPELYEALEALSSETPKTRAQLNEATAKAASALAKARGES